MKKRPPEELTVQRYAEILAHVTYFRTPRKSEADRKRKGYRRGHNFGKCRPERPWHKCCGG